MATVGEIDSFLKTFKEKLGIWGLIFRSDRDKNHNTMKELELSVIHVKKELAAISFEDYSEGPTKDTLYKGSDMWIFGRTIRSREVYIKITMGQPGNEVLCISFHFPEGTMKYPYKK